MAEATGQQRRDAAVDELRRELAALQPHASPSGALIRIGPHRATCYDAVWDGFQGYARPLWAMAALARSGEAGRLGDEIWTQWRRGLCAGTDPDHADYWGPVEDLCQGFCEMPAVATALVWASGQLWEPLSSGQQQQVRNWLLLINQHKVHSNNWRWFRILVNLSLEVLQPGQADWGRVHADLDDLDAMHQGDGWYLDGCNPGTRSADLYLPAAFHTYGPIAAELLQSHDPGRAAELLDRSRAFARNYRHFFATDGSLPLWGRSLVYREVWAASWATLALIDDAPIPWPEIAGLWRRHRAWWQSRPCHRDDGCLALGCTYPNAATAELYISETSSLWWMKSLLALAQPAEHPFWSGADAPPVPRPETLACALIGGLLAGSEQRPLWLLVGQYGPAWMEGRQSRYNRFVYSAQHGFESGVSDDGLPPPDATLLIRPEGDSQWYGRDRPILWSVSSQAAKVQWSPVEGLEITSTLTPQGHGCRLHHVLTTTRRLEVIAGGLSCPAPAQSEIGTDQVRLLGRDQTGQPVVSRLTGLAPLVPSIFTMPANSNLQHPASSVPVLRASLPPGRHKLVTEIYTD